MKAAEESRIDADMLLDEYGPHLPCRRPAEPGARRGGPPEPIPYDRAMQEKRLRKAERELPLLGKVNPLALEEFAALEERYKFLSDQLEDLKATRDLLTSSRTSTSASCRSSPTPSPTPRASSSRSSRSSSRAARAGWS